MQNIKVINDFGHNNHVTIDMNFGYSFGVVVNMRRGNLVRSVSLNDSELSNNKVDFLTLLELMYEDLLATEVDNISEQCADLIF